MRKLLIILLFFPVFLWAGNVKFSTSSDKKSYFNFEKIYLTYKVENASYEGIEIPKSNDFDVLNKRISTSSSSFVIIQNGKRISQGDEVYDVTFELKPKHNGTITIPKGILKVGDKTLTAPSFTVEVKEMKVNDNQLSKDRFITVEVSNSQPYVGQSFTITYTLYTVDQITDGSQFKNPEAFINFGPFTVKELSRLSGSQVNLKGKIYTVVEYQTHLLTPLKAESVTIPSFNIDYVGFNYIRESWFSSRREEVPYSVSAPKTSIKVKSLPQAPVNFSGLVGDFTGKLKLDKTKLSVNDAITAKYEITGKGNFSVLEDLPIEWEGVWEVFDPKISDNFKANSKGYSGKKVFEYVAIPRKPGKFILPKISLSYFDLSSKKYKNFEFDAPTITVDGTADASQSFVSSGSIGKKVKAEGNDIRYIKTDFDLKNNVKNDFFGSTWFYGLSGLSLSGFLFLVFFYDKKEQNTNEINNLKNKQASKKAKLILKEAEKALQNNDNLFYAKVEEAFNRYLMDKFTIAPTEFSKDFIIETLNKNGVTDEMIQQVIQVQNQCNLARYSPIGIDKNQIYQQVANVITHLG